MRVTIDDVKMERILKTVGRVLAKGGMQLSIPVEAMSPTQKVELARLVIDDILGDVVLLLKQDAVRAAQALASVLDHEDIEEFVGSLQDRHVVGQLGNRRGLGKYIEDLTDDNDKF